MKPQRRFRPKVGTPFKGGLDPRRALPLIIIAAFFAVAGLWYTNLAYGEAGLRFFRDAALTAFSALLAAWVGLWIYWHINTEVQNRQFQRELEVRYFEKIYGPLYEETAKIVEALGRFEGGFLAAWVGIKKGRFGPFVEPNIAASLDRLAERLEALREIKAVEAARANILEVAKDPPFGIVDPAQENIVRALVEDNRFLFDVDAAPARHTVDRIRGYFEKLAYPSEYIEGDPVEIFLDEAKKSLLESEAVRERRRRMPEVLVYAKHVHQRILERMGSPFRSGGPIKQT